MDTSANGQAHKREPPAVLGAAEGVRAHGRRGATRLAHQAHQEEPQRTRRAHPHHLQNRIAANLLTARCGVDARLGLQRPALDTEHIESTLLGETRGRLPCRTRPSLSHSLSRFPPNACTGVHRRAKRGFRGASRGAVDACTLRMRKIPCRTLAAAICPISSKEHAVSGLVCHRLGGTKA